jgi:hypothetical protein
MNKNNLIQFIKDGLVGLAAACLMYVPITLAIFFIFGGKPLEQTSLYTGLYYMPPVCLSMFLSLGINARFTEGVIPGKDWVQPILKMAGVSWLIAAFVIGMGLYLNSILDGILAFTLIVGGAISIPLAFVSAYVIAVEFNNPESLPRLFIPVMTGILVIISLPAGWYFGGMIYMAIFMPGCC